MAKYGYPDQFPGPSVTKLFTVVAYKDPVKLFQPSLKFVSEVLAYLSEAPFRHSNVG
jgi:hypothetical protein